MTALPTFMSLRLSRCYDKRLGIEVRNYEFPGCFLSSLVSFSFAVATVALATAGL